MALALRRSSFVCRFSKACRDGSRVGNTTGAVVEFLIAVPVLSVALTGKKRQAASKGCQGTHFVPEGEGFSEFFRIFACII